MNAINLQPINNNKKKVHGYNTAVKNSLNHFLLNKLLVLRYHVRKKPFFIKTIIVLETILVKMHLISNHNQ
jgi:hypothetical protein